jgi:RNA polymerase sigma-70 factor (ECF subfamily)
VSRDTVERLREVPATDGEVVARVRSGDTTAFRVLYRRHARRVAGLVYRVLGDEHELEDIVQESFASAARSLPELRDPEKFGPWLSQIAVCHVRRRLQRRSRQRWLQREMAFVAPREQRAEQDVELLYRVLDQLPPKLRIPWSLHRLEEHTLPATAEYCGVSLATVKRRVSKAEEFLRRRIGDG